MKKVFLRDELKKKKNKKKGEKICKKKKKTKNIQNMSEIKQRKVTAQNNMFYHHRLTEPEI